MPRELIWAAACFGIGMAAFALFLSSRGPAEGSPPARGAATGKTLEAKGPAEQASPKLTVTPASHDIGTQKEGEKIRRTFVLGNEGSAPLSITGIVPRCGSCLTVEIKRREIPPGESEDLAVQYELTDRVGKFVRYIVVESNDPKNGSVSLILQGETVPEFEVSPPKISFGEVLTNASPSVRLKLKRNFGGSLEIAGPAQMPSGLKVGLPERLTAPEKETAEVPVALMPGLSPGPYKADLVLHVNGTLHKELTIPVTAKVVSPIRLAEDDIFFGIVPAKESATKTVAVMLAAGVDSGRVSIKCDADCLTAEYRPGDAESGPSVKLDLLPTGKLGPFRAKVRLEAPAESGPAWCEAVCYGIRSG